LNADRLTRWMTLAANLGVVLGLILLVAELNQNREMTRAEIRHDLSMGIVELLLVPANNQQLADVLYRAQTDAEMSHGEVFQFQLRTNALFRYWEDVHYQYRAGLYDKAEFERQRGAWSAFFARTPRGRTYWCEVRSLYSPDFAAEMDRMLTKNPCGKAGP